MTTAVMCLIDVYRHGDEELFQSFLYELMRERDPEINISHSSLPTWDEHVAFMAGKPYRAWYVIHLSPDQLIGYVSASYRNEIGIVLRRQFRGHGLGADAVKMLMTLHQPLPRAPSLRSGSWLANIAPDNEVSRKMFSKLGFSKIQDTYALVNK